MSTEPLTDEALERMRQRRDGLLFDGPAKARVDRAFLLIEVDRLRALLASSNTCEICKVHLEPQSPRCEQHAHTELIECDVCGEPCPNDELCTHEGEPACSEACAGWEAMEGDGFNGESRA